MESNFKLSRREKTGLVARYLRGCWRYFLAAILFACLSMALNALTPQVIRLTVDSILDDQAPALPAWLLSRLDWAVLRAEPGRALLWAAGAVLLIALVRGLCSYVQRIQLARGSESFVKGIRDDLYRHIQHLSFAWHKNNPTGDIIQRCTSDVDVIRSFVCAQLVEVVRTVFLIFLYLFIMFRMNVRLSLVAALFIPIVGLSSGVFYRKISSRFQAADEAEGALTTCAQENLTGVRVVRAFGRERFEDEKFQEKNRHFSNLWIRLGKLLSVYWASGTLLTCLQVMVIILVGVTEAVHGRMTLGSFLAFISYNEALSWPVRSLGRVLSEMSKAGVSLDRVGYILSSPEESDPGQPEPFVPGDIVFDHVTCAYEGQPVLQDRLYDLEPGQGRITIGSVDLRDMARDDVRKHIGLVLQEPFLFSQTIGENIRAAQPHAPEETVRRAAAIACVDEAISTFPQGYDTLVGERGVTLSGGQKQRVAIARMLLQEAPILVFDDSLSAVDAETDAKIRAALKDTLASATVILISHRITTLMQADRILVLDGGRAAQLGTHAQLIAQPGIYREIYDIQMRADDRALILEGGNA